MREKITKNRKYILMVLGILILALFNVGMRYLATRPRYKTLPEVRIIDKKEENTKSYAVMVSNESGDGYIEYTNEGGTWPSEEEGYEFKEAKCMDNNGTLVQNAVTFADGKVTLKTNKTIYCTLYFDKKLLEITDVKVSAGCYDATLTVTAKGGSGKYTYSIDDSKGHGRITYNENIITISSLDPGVEYSYVIKVTDSNGLYTTKETTFKTATSYGTSMCSTI